MSSFSPPCMRRASNRRQQSVGRILSTILLISGLITSSTRTTCSAQAEEEEAALMTSNTSGGGDCPVTAEFAAQCQCTAVPDMRCRNVKTMPVFTANSFIYYTLYLERQAIKFVPKGKRFLVC